MNNLGRIYETGKSMYGKDPMKAAQFYMKAAGGGNADAMTNLGYLIENAFGSSVTSGTLAKSRAAAATIQGSIAKAAEWYRLAAEKYEYARAQNFLGSIYYSGKHGFEKDYPEALKW
jgi:TPR repeat protein